MNYKNITIRSTRLCLKPFSIHDADEIYPCITPTLTRYMAWEPAKSRQEYDQNWHNRLVNMENGQEIIFVIRHMGTHEFLGLVGLHQCHTTTPELGIWIREDRHHASFGREAVRLVAEWASTHYALAYFIYPVATENYASRHIAESLGGVAVDYEQKPKYESVMYHIPVRVV